MADGLSAKEWAKRYETGKTPWDLGSVSPPFVAAVKSGRFPPGRLAIPGCGRGHEAIYFARQGFSVTAFDIAAPACAAVEAAAQRAAVDVDAVTCDVLSPPKSFVGAFDYVLEQTFFCAIHPNRRSDYVCTVAALLKPAGVLFGLFFDFESDSGPPFGTSAAELEALFTPTFAIRSLGRCHSSHPRREGEELWAEFIRSDE